MLFRKNHFLEYLEDFILYEQSGETYEKKIRSQSSINFIPSKKQ